MIDHSDHAIKVEEKISQQFSVIYSDLSSKYNRTSEMMENDEPISVVAAIIENYWNIPANISEQDLGYEENRRVEHMLSLPDIPTYKIRFAIEEGSWIVLLRDYFKQMVNDAFTRLISLDELIWETGAAQKEDLAYYLLELLQIGEKWVTPTFRIWKEHHDYGTLRRFAFLIIASYHQNSISRGQLMFEGGIRLLKSKMDILSGIEAFDNTSPWSTKAKNLYQDIINTDLNTTSNEAVLISIIVLALLQKELIQKRLQRQALPEDGANDMQNFPWKSFDPMNLEERDKFSEIILRKLYRRVEEDPREAAKNLIRDFLSENEIDTDEIEQVNTKLSNSLEGIDSNRDIIERIQIILPKLLIRLKLDQVKTKEANSSYDKIDKMEIWDAFTDNIRRVKRINDDDISRKMVFKAVKSVYFTLIEMKMTQIKIMEEILKRFGKEFDIENLYKIIDTSREKIEEATKESKMMREIDDIILEDIVEQIHSIAISKKL